jgi:hypothetical protein
MHGYSPLASRRILETRQVLYLEVERRVAGAKACKENSRQAKFRPTLDEVKRLTASEAVDVLRDMLFTEARSIGLPPTEVSVTTAITTRDGGIDARIDCSVPTTGPAV